MLTLIFQLMYIYIYFFVVLEDTYLKFDIPTLVISSGKKVITCFPKSILISLA